MKASIRPLTRQSRRSFLRNAASLAAAAAAPTFLLGSEQDSFSLRPSPVKGINLGVITYSFRSMPGSAEDLLEYLSSLSLNTVELMGGPAEAFAGAPRDASKEELRAWRSAAPMDRFKALKKMYRKEGVRIEIVKFRMDRMTDEEIHYCFRAAKALGAKGITLERSDEASRRLAPFADEYKRLIGYHNHAKVDVNSWDQVLADSQYHALNLDVGHYMAGTNESAAPLIRKHASRILSLHLKDRKKNNGKNMPWGQGDTPLAEILRLLRDEQYTFQASIELEYEIPEGSDAVKEVGKCIDYCRDALA